MTDTAASPPSYRRRIEQKLTQRLAPIRLEIEDESHRHAGHAGHRAEGEISFEDAKEALREELAERVHALAMTTLTPDEAANAGR